MTRTGALSPQSRDQAIGAMVGAAGEAELDVLVVEEQMSAGRVTTLVSAARL